MSKADHYVAKKDSDCSIEMIDINEKKFKAIQNAYK